MMDPTESALSFWILGWEKSSLVLLLASVVCNKGSTPLF